MCLRDVERLVGRSSFFLIFHHLQEKEKKLLNLHWFCQTCNFLGIETKSLLYFLLGFLNFESLSISIWKVLSVCIAVTPTVKILPLSFHIFPYKYFRQFPFLKPLIFIFFPFSLLAVLCRAGVAFLLPHKVRNLSLFFPPFRLLISFFLSFLVFLNNCCGN